MTTTHFVVSAPGYYGDTTRVLSAHRSVEAARKARGTSPQFCIREGALAKGDTFRRADEQHHPIVK